jgi:hypothetical protein
MHVTALRAAPLALALLAGSAQAVVVAVDENAFAGVGPVLDFEEFTANVDVVESQFAGFGISFSSQSNGGWPVEPHSDYGSTFADAATAAGAGDNGLFHLNDGEAIVFDPPVTRVAFQFGSNVDVDVPITISRGGQQTGSFHLVVAENQLPFFGFQDPQGIDRIDFGTELNSEFVSQLDNVRFEREPTGSVALAGSGSFSNTGETLDFEAFTANVDVVSTQFSGLGVLFDSGAGGWSVEPHSDYGLTFADAATAAGAGANGLVHENDAEEIVFDPPVKRVGFQFGSNVDVQVPITFHRGGMQVGSAELLVGDDHLPFYGFEDPQGIDRIAFGTEQNSQFVSQLDNLRFERIDTIAPEDIPGSAPLLGFEEFTANQSIVSNQFAAQGISFTSQSNGGWPVEPYSDYSQELVDAALAAGAGDKGLFHENDGEEILFDPPASKVGFLFGSNVDVRVPITLYLGGVQTGSYELDVAQDQLQFFGFGDDGGIDRIAFGKELNSEFVSQLDNVRFAPEPGGAGATAAAVATLALCARRRRSAAGTSSTSPPSAWTSGAG